MARKTSDIAMLLGSRSKSRSRSSKGFGSSLVGFVDNLLGRAGGSRGRRRSEKRPQMVSAWVFGIGLLVAFGGGFFFGGKFGGGDAGPDALRANGREPALLNEIETQPLSSQAFIVSSYQGVPDTEAKTRAQDLSNYLREQGLASARPYPWPQDQGVLWLVAVYFDGEQDAAQKTQVLQRLPAEVPDKMFVHWRKTESVWPMRWQIQ